MNNKKVVKNDDVIDIELENNKKVQGKILFTFNENGDQFILYEIDGTAYGGKLKYDNSIMPISDDEWGLVEQIFNQWMEENED
ncbi:MAG: hypothetical protein IKG36_00855 [Mycoplasmataceae bacterium]|nr:hypothetical protein [Mycoplasmataceae bacterium]